MNFKFLFNKINIFHSNKKNILLFFVFFILSLILSYPVMTDKFLIGHDTKFFIGVIDGLRDNILNWHQIPYRINYDYSMGNLQPIYYHNTFLYITALLQVLFNTKFEFDFGVLYNPASICITYYLIHLFSGISMYMASNSIFKNKKIAFASALFYLFSYVRLKLAYNNGMFGMIISFIFIPIFILSLYELFFRNEEKWYFFVLSASFLFQTHIITSYLFAIFTLCLFVFFLFTNFSKLRLFFFIKSLIVTFLLNLFLLFPILYCIIKLNILNPAELYLGTFINGSLSYSVNLENFFKFFPPISSNYFSPGIFLVIGIIIILIYLSYILLNKFFINKSVDNSIFDIDNNIYLNKYINFLSILSIVFMLLIFNFYDLSNKILHVLFSILQFRMRFYMLVIPLAAICFPYIVYLFLNKILNNQKFINILYILFFVSISLISGIYIINDVKNNANYADSVKGIYNLDYALRDAIVDFNSPIFFPDELIETSNENIHILNSNFNNRTNVNFEYEIKNFNDMQINNKLYVDIALYDYPVYKASDENNNQIEFSHGDHGRIRLYLNKNHGKVNIKQVEPFSWIIADFISLFTIIFCIYSIILKKIKKNSI